MFAPNGPWPKERLTFIDLVGEYIYPRYDPYDDMFHLTADACGFEIKFRPFDSVDQSQVPGVSVSVTAAKSTQWLSPGEVMGLPPDGLTLDEVARGVGVRSHSQAMVYHMLMSDIAQNQPAASGQCSSLGQSVRRCPHRSDTAAAFSACFFILNAPRFVRCYDDTDNGDLVLQLFRECFEALCFKDATQCELVKRAVRKCSNKNIAEMRQFLQRPC
ncbi:hypothetical protein ElyMa_001391500 [Elysia marginata]|uniref:Uncharacterized protein n=1 Tax=Elysia marginata TaxID=1093978 RepID=A0AAV4IXH1_9GAST|nr:hypothetical protein ElyMa_001391500 [Elysia marginata]